MCVYVYICVYRFSYIDRCVSVSVYICVHMCTFVHVRACVHMCEVCQVHVCIGMYANCPCTCTCGHMRKHVYIGICVFMNISVGSRMNIQCLHALCVDAYMRIYVFYVYERICVYIMDVGMHYTTITDKKAQRPPRAVELSCL